ncbi:hypothetical protein [Streptomyces sp. T028]|uniref:hypothetical protein n=1 Tax=Streptomyces sp. T028 TaxID=3394379 RepID=UPI003A87957D
MPMLFLVAGLGARYSIDRRSPGGFARERLLRLGVPLRFLRASSRSARIPAASPSYSRGSISRPVIFDILLWLKPGDERIRTGTRRLAVLVGVLGLGLFGAAGWCWVVAILGLLERLPAPRVGPVLGYLALPLYVLHQPVVVAFAYGVVGWDAPIAVKYAAIVAASLAATLLLYEYGVRRTRVTRFLFGTRAAPPSEPPS